MKIGDQCTLLQILPMKNHRGKKMYFGIRGKFGGWTKDRHCRILKKPDGGEVHVGKGPGGYFTTKRVDLSPCGIKE